MRRSLAELIGRRSEYGLIGLCLGGYRLCNGPATDAGERHADHLGVDEVYVMDPMGRPWAGYTGVWARGRKGLRPQPAQASR